MLAFAKVLLVTVPGRVVVFRSKNLKKKRIPSSMIYMLEIIYYSKIHGWVYRLYLILAVRLHVFFAGSKKNTHSTSRMVASNFYSRKDKKSGLSWSENISFSILHFPPFSPPSCGHSQAHVSFSPFSPLCSGEQHQAQGEVVWRQPSWPVRSMQSCIYRPDDQVSAARNLVPVSFLFSFRTEEEAKWNHFRIKSGSQQV